MNKFLALLLPFCLMPMSLAQDTQKKNLDDIVIEDDPLFKVLEERQKNQRTIRPKPISNEQKHLSLEKNTKELYQDEVQIFWALLKAESVITEVDKEKRTFTTPKKIYVKVRKEKDNYQTYYILNKENQIRYETRKENIVSLQDVADLNAAPKYYVEYPTPREYDGGDKILILKPYYALHLETFADQGQSARATRNEAKIFYGWKQPYEFGLSFSFESGNYTQTESEATASSWQSFYIGPTVRWLSLKTDLLLLSFDLSLQKSMGYTLSNPEFENKYSSEAFEFGGDLLFPTKLGQFTTGIHWRILRRALDSSTDQNQSAQTDKSGFTAYAISFGYGKELAW